MKNLLLLHAFSLYRQFYYEEIYYLLMPKTNRKYFVVYLPQSVAFIIALLRKGTLEHMAAMTWLKDKIPTSEDVLM